ncbi:retinol dehydrogenase 11 isoform X2 [Takifugu rubripes]|uniref:retinol dehydrogenase 11 isoform X2 n=1 Tax=Takifugu rubripes TaxID=31033 RepID=UPI001145437A|nr:retinol dehydrogenase 11-like isoform X2 [Takifugu rubripes]
MLWVEVFYHPIWVFSTALLAAVVHLQRRRRWDPKVCSVRLQGKVAVVTGANTGIGKFIALDLARRGARVILACRSAARGSAALKEISEKTGNPDVHLRLVDVSSLDSVREFAKGILEEEKALHILVNNAGVSGLPSELTKDGLEISFATNHLGPFLLTTLLLDLMKRSAPARIVNLSSFNHKKGTVDFSHYHGKNLSHRMDRIYNNTKLHIVLITNELARLLQGTGVVANSVDPGIVTTEVLRHYSFILRWLFKFIGFFFFKSPEEGAVSTIFCAVSEEMEGITGKYVDSNCTVALPAPVARDPALAVKVFEMSKRVTSKL